MTHFPSDFGLSADPQKLRVRPRDTFTLRSVEGPEHPVKPYEMRVLRAHRDVGYWEVVVVSGGNPARHGFIDVMSETEILHHIFET